MDITRIGYSQKLLLVLLALIICVKAQASDFDLEWDLVHEGDYFITSGTTNLNGHKLHITGSLVQEGGTLFVNSGELIVDGDYRIQRIEDDAEGGTTYKYSNGRLKMIYSGDVVIVGGDFITDTSKGHDGFLTAGVINIAGNLSQLKSNASSSTHSFYTSDNFKTVLNGTGVQNIYFESPSSSRFNVLELEAGSSGMVYFLNGMTIDSFVTNGVTLPEFMIDEGSVTLADDLSISGDLIIKGGGLVVSGNSVSIEGDFRIQNTTEDDEGEVTYSQSSGTLRMNNNADKVTVGGDFITDSTIKHNGLLTAGVLKVAGNFSQSGSSQSFYTSDAFKTVLNGAGVQNINFDAPSGSKFNTLELESGSSGLVYFLNGMTIESFISNGVTIQELMVDAGTTTLADDLSISEDLFINGGTFDVSGHSVLVGRDLRIQEVMEDENGEIVYKYSSGKLKMVEEEDQVSVGRDFITDSTINHDELLIAGVLTIGGNFSQLKTTAVSSGWNFHPSDNFKTVLNGTGHQNIYFQNPDTSKFITLELASDSSGMIYFLNGMTIESFISNGVILPELQIDGGSTVLADDLTIAGDLLIKGGSFSVSGNSVSIGGDLRVQDTEEDVVGEITYKHSSGSLIMNNDADIVTVGGDFFTDSTIKHNNLLTAGVLKVAGDFTQLETYSTSSNNFYSSDSFTTVLNGTVLQNIFFQTPKGSQFNTLISENISAEGVVFASDVTVTKLFDHQRLPFTLTGNNNSFVDFDGDLLLDPDDRYPTIHNELDTDEDGLTDVVELDIGSDENNPDSDGDGQLDGYDSEPLDERYIGTSFTTANVTSEFSTIYQPGYFDIPVVIAGPPSFNDPDPGVVQIMDIFEGVGETGVTLRFKEWNYLGDTGDYEHGEETIPLMILESGRMKMADGSVWEAGTFEVNGTGKFKSVKFTSPFEGHPLLLLTVQSSDSDYVVLTPRVRDLTEEGFRAAIFEEELAGKGYESAVVGYLAGYSLTGTGDVNFGGEMVTYEVSSHQVNERWEDIGTYQIKLEEEQSKDDETVHVSEEVNVLMLKESLFAQDVSSKGNDTASIRYIETPN